MIEALREVIDDDDKKLQSVWVGLVTALLGTGPVNSGPSWSEWLLGGFGFNAVGMIAFLLIMGWWLVAVGGDLALFWSLVLCIGHSIQFRQIEQRRRERD